MTKELHLKQKIDAVVEKAESVGINSFMLLVPNGVSMSLNYHKMDIADVMRLLIASFHHTISLEIDKHPEWSEEYKELYRSTSREFDQLIAERNKKFKQFKGKKTIKK